MPCQWHKRHKTELKRDTNSFNKTRRWTLKHQRRRGCLHNHRLRPAVTLTFDLQDTTRSSVEASEYSLLVSLLEPFMRYCGQYLTGWMQKWTNGTAENTRPSLTWADDKCIEKLLSIERHHKLENICSRIDMQTHAGNGRRYYTTGLRDVGYSH